MKLQFILLLTVALSFTSCSVLEKILPTTNPANVKGVKSQKTNYVYFDDITLGKELHRAKNNSNRVFFEHLMSNSIDKSTQTPVYEVVLDTSTDLYYGVVRAEESGKDSKVIVDPFYKTPIGDIKLYFPGYSDITGRNVKSKMYFYFFDRLVETKLKPICPNSYATDYTRFNTTLVESGIRVNAVFHAKCYEDIAYAVEVVAVLDSENLDVLKEYTLTNNRTQNEIVEKGVKDESAPVFGNKISNIFD